MRHADGGHVLDLEIRVDRGLDVANLVCDLLGLGALLPVQQGDARAVAGGVANRCHLAQITVGDQSKHHGVHGVNVAAERAGQQDAVDRLDAFAS